MSASIPDFDTVPTCCWNCAHKDSDYSEFSDVTYHFCNLNIAFPVRKQSCKKQTLLTPMREKG